MKYKLIVESCEAEPVTLAGNAYMACLLGEGQTMVIPSTYFFSLFAEEEAEPEPEPEPKRPVKKTRRQPEAAADNEVKVVTFIDRIRELLRQGQYSQIEIANHFGLEGKARQAVYAAMNYLRNQAEVERIEDATDGTVRWRML